MCPCLALAVSECVNVCCEAVRDVQLLVSDQIALLRAHLDDGRAHGHLEELLDVGGEGSAAGDDRAHVAAEARLHLHAVARALQGERAIEKAVDAAGKQAERPAEPRAAKTVGRQAHLAEDRGVETGTREGRAAKTVGRQAHLAEDNLDPEGEASSKHLAEDKPLPEGEASSKHLAEGKPDPEGRLAEDREVGAEMREGREVRKQAHLAEDYLVPEGCCLVGGEALLELAQLGVEAHVEEHLHAFGVRC